MYSIRISNVIVYVDLSGIYPDCSGFLYLYWWSLICLRRRGVLHGCCNLSNTLFLSERDDHNHQLVQGNGTRLSDDSQDGMPSFRHCSLPYYRERANKYCLFARQLISGRVDFSSHTTHIRTIHQPAIASHNSQLYKFAIC